MKAVSPSSITKPITFNSSNILFLSRKNVNKDITLQTIKDWHNGKNQFVRLIK